MIIKLKAFTLVEVILTVTILMIGIGAGVSWTLQAINSVELQSATESVVSLVRNAQAAAQKNYEDKNQGIFLESNKYSYFMGDSYDLSAAEDRQEFELPQGIEIAEVNLNGGLEEIVFQKGKGDTEEYGSFKLLHSASGDYFTVSIFPLGLIDFE